VFVEHLTSNFPIKLIATDHPALHGHSHSE